MAKRAAGFIIFRRACDRIQYLLMQTSYGEHHWTPPKGHVDPGENDMQTALRETEEEAGYKKEHLNIMDDFKKVLEYEVNGAPKTVIYWLAELKDPSVSVTMSDEHQAFEWLELQEACDKAKYKEMVEALKDCNQYLHRN